MAALVTLVVVADQATKHWAHALPWAEPVANPDLALGVAGGHPNLLTALMTVALAVFGWHLIGRVRDGKLSIAIAALLLGGAMGNLIDRALLSSVRDFIPTPWLILNLADLALLAGATGYLRFSPPVPLTSRSVSQPRPHRYASK